MLTTRATAMPTGWVRARLLTVRGMASSVALLCVAGLVCFFIYWMEGWMLGRAEQLIDRGDFASATGYLHRIHIFRKPDAERLTGSLREYEQELYNAAVADFSSAKYSEVIGRLSGKKFQYKRADCALLLKKAKFAHEHSRASEAARQGNMKLVFDFIHKYPLDKAGNELRLQSLNHTHYLNHEYTYSSLHFYARKRIRVSGYMLGDLKRTSDGSAYIGYLTIHSRLIRPIVLVFDAKVANLDQLEADGMVAGNRIDICGFVSEASNGSPGKNRWIREDIPPVYGHMRIDPVEGWTLDR